MLLAGVISIVACLFGYLRAGGGELLLQQALVTFWHSGQASFKHVKFDFETATLKVEEITQSAYKLPDGQGEVKGVTARNCLVKLDLWPVPRVESLTIEGLSAPEVSFETGFFQRNMTKHPHGPPFPIYLEDADIGVRVGKSPLLKLGGCSGALRQRGTAGTNPTEKREDLELIGEFRVHKLNERPFNFTLSSLADGRWEFNGTDLNLDTKDLAVDSVTLETETVDPVEKLLQLLMPGGFGARGQVTSAQVIVQPRTVDRPFGCEGRLAYRDLEVHLPKRGGEGAELVPKFLHWIFGGQQDKALWPSWLMAESIRTGPRGRLSFHMYENRLEFWCDEGKDGAFIFRAKDQDLATLESLKGVIETDEQQHIKSVLLRGFLGENLEAEVSMTRLPESAAYPHGGRLFVAGIQPRARTGASLWRLTSHVKDYTDSVSLGDPSGKVLADFDIELQAVRFEEVRGLPPGVSSLSGRIGVKGRLLSNRLLYADEIRWEDGGLTFGGAAQAQPELERMYGPVFDALVKMWGGVAGGWRLQDVNFSAKAELRFEHLNDQEILVETHIKEGKLASGKVVYDDQTTDFGSAKILLSGDHFLSPPKGQVATAFSAKPSEGDWRFDLKGGPQPDGTLQYTYDEVDVPLKLHPQRNSLESKFKSFWGTKVRRTIVAKIKDGHLELSTVP